MNVENEVTTKNDEILLDDGRKIRIIDKDFVDKQNEVDKKVPAGAAGGTLGGSLGLILTLLIKEYATSRGIVIPNELARELAYAMPEIITIAGAFIGSFVGGYFAPSQRVPKVEEVTHDDNL